MLSSGAAFDITNTYRYSLWRGWSTDYPQVTFIMLNPSRADAQRNDPTIRRCIEFAQRWGFGSLEVVNLFAYRAAYPVALFNATNPVGAENDQFLMRAVARSAWVVAAWGTKGTLLDRDKHVLQLLAHCRNIHCLRCLGLTREGHPRHPLYVKGDAGLLAFPPDKILHVTGQTKRK